MLLSILLNPLRVRLQQLVDSAFFRRQIIYQERLQSFSHKLIQATELSEVVTLLRETVDHDLHPNSLHIFLHDTLSGNYHATQDDNGKNTSDLLFSTNSALVDTLSRRQGAIYLGRSESLPEDLRTDSFRIAILGAQLFVPLPGRGQLVGWLGIESPVPDTAYDEDDLDYIESLCEQAALAIERIQVVANMEYRVREMDVLTRVAQGVNITLAFDDILELIYTQSSQLIPSHDFRITLNDKNTDSLYHAFYLENDERINQQENHSFPINQGLEAEIIRSRRSLLTDDYEHECLHKGVIPDTQGVYAWLSVPMNAGAETIGAISLGNRDPNNFYSQQQCNLLQAIADQTAGAIVKTRLLEESEQRTQQLSTLNEIGRSLTSTLEIDSLLNRIMQSATAILSCQAGSLFLLDFQTGELIFKVTVGPVAEDLEGRRLPPGAGIAGKAVTTRQPVIANDVHSSQSWFNQTDQQTGFITREVMVVPMQVKDRIIGVIEVINKQDNSSFTLDDQKLLDTFAIQAAIAIENARLYTQTDEALSARVEEMSVMQRIDRELNTSLDLLHTMRITLDWSLQQSNSTAGIIGFIEKVFTEQQEYIHVIASRGYTSELDDFLNDGDSSEAITHRIPVKLIPNMSQAMEDAQARCTNFPSDTEDRANSPCFLVGTKSQITVPIQRQAKNIGMILLESEQAETCSDEIITFLSRLSDHAAIAISNAQLYADLQAANLAKSEFVSLVSHELKTPMTSIKGYADLLAQGTVGSVNDIQATFLNTIRSNVNRMDTLVSDLADVSRIEADRLRLEFSAISIIGTIQEVVRSSQGQFDEKEQSLKLQVPDDLPSVWGDNDRIIQILTNLVSNANKYTPPRGQITIFAQRKDNEWDPQGAPEVVLISVQDTGYGISPEDQQQIFQKFFRSDDQNIRDTTGTGLGLNITQHLVEMQGGRIWFDSDLGTGTTFSFTIPVSATTAVFT